MKLDELCALIEKGKNNNHSPRIVGVTMDDTCACSCGWQSIGYWDGAEYAYDDWAKHYKQVENSFATKIKVKENTNGQA